MVTPASIAGLFFTQGYTVAAASETFKVAEWRYESKLLRLCEADALKTIFAAIPDRDQAQVSITFESESVSISSEEPERVEEFLQDCQTYLRVIEAESRIALSIIITKRTLEGIVSLYSLEAFTKTLRSKELPELFGLFADVTHSDTATLVEMPDGTAPFSTHTLIFWTKDCPRRRVFARGEVRSKRNDICHFEAEDYPVVPEDFQLVERSPTAELNAVFDSLCVVSSIVFLADVSQFKLAEGHQVLSFKLNGYRSVTGSVPRKDVDPRMAAECFKIYEWVYSGGNVSDKIGLARNVISLHWKGDETDLVESGVLASIRSGYEIYLKQNVRAYIEVKNKLSEFLTDFSEKAVVLADGLTEKLEKNVAAFIVFFISSVIAKVATDKSFTGVLTPALAVIGITIIGFSFIHLAVSLIVFNKDKAKIEQDFDALKARYADILDAKDLDNIFVRTGAWERTVDQLRFKRRLLVSFWIISMSIFLALVLAFTDWKSAGHSTGVTQTTNSGSAFSTGSGAAVRSTHQTNSGRAGSNATAQQFAPSQLPATSSRATNSVSPNSKTNLSKP
jgi:hypothetical protein